MRNVCGWIAARTALLSRRPLLSVFLLLVTATVLTGCQTPAPSTALTGMPGDFSVEVAVLTRDPAMINEDTPPVARYVVHANGALHVARESQVWQNRYPGLARQLQTNQMVAIWQQVSAVGVSIDQALAASQTASDVAVAPTGTLSVDQAPESGVAYFVWWREAGRERGYLLYGPSVRDDAEALAWTLGELAWM